MYSISERNTVKIFHAIPAIHHGCDMLLAILYSQAMQMKKKNKKEKATANFLNTGLHIHKRTLAGILTTEKHYSNSLFLVFSMTLLICIHHPAYGLELLLGGSVFCHVRHVLLWVGFEPIRLCCIIILYSKYINKGKKETVADRGVFMAHISLGWKRKGIKDRPPHTRTGCTSLKKSKQTTKRHTNFVISTSTLSG